MGDFETPGAGGPAAGVAPGPQSKDFETPGAGGPAAEVAPGPQSKDFDDLLAANKEYAAAFDQGGFDGVAHAGIAVITCMDSRIEPLKMLGLDLGDAKIFRNPGGRITPQALEALVLGTHLLNVRRILVVPHTRCAMAANSEDDLRRQIAASAGTDPSWQRFSVVTDQLAALEDDVRKVRAHPLIPEDVAVGGFIYDVDTGTLEQRF